MNGKKNTGRRECVWSGLVTVFSSDITDFLPVFEFRLRSGTGPGAPHLHSMHLLGRVSGRVRHSSLVRSRYASGASRHYEVVYVSGIKSLGNAFTLPFAHPKAKVVLQRREKT
jgi:hypothetical protein